MTEKDLRQRMAILEQKDFGSGKPTHVGSPLERPVVLPKPDPVTPENCRDKVDPFVNTVKRQNLD